MTIYQFNEDFETTYYAFVRDSKRILFMMFYKNEVDGQPNFEIVDWRTNQYNSLYSEVNIKDSHRLKNNYKVIIKEIFKSREA